MFFKNLCVKVLKVNTTSQLFFSIFRAFRHGALLFYHSLLFLHCWVWNRQYSVFPTNWKSLKSFCKNLCDKVLKMKIMSCLSFSIQFFQQIENLSTVFAKISVTKFWKWKLWVAYLLIFSVLSVVLSFFFTTASCMCVHCWV